MNRNIEIEVCKCSQCQPRWRDQPERDVSVRVPSRTQMGFIDVNGVILGLGGDGERGKISFVWWIKVPSTQHSWEHLVYLFVLSSSPSGSLFCSLLSCLDMKEDQELPAAPHVRGCRSDPQGGGAILITAIFPLEWSLYGRKLNQHRT